MVGWGGGSNWEVNGHLDNAGAGGEGGGASDDKVGSPRKS